MHSYVKLKPHAVITFNQKSCDCCRTMESSTTSYPTEIGNVEEPEIEVNMSHSAAYCGLFDRMVEEKWCCREGFAKRWWLRPYSVINNFSEL